MHRPFMLQDLMFLPVTALLGVFVTFGASEQLLDNTSLSLAKVIALVVAVASATWIISRKLTSIEIHQNDSVEDRKRLNKSLDQIYGILSRLPCREGKCSATEEPKE